MPPQGAEQGTKSPGKTNQNANGGNAGGNIRAELESLMEIWPNLPNLIRKQCLAWLKSQTKITPNADG